VRESECRRNRGCGRGGLLVHPDHGVQGMLPGKHRGRAGTGGRVAEVESQKPGGIQSLERARLLGRDDDVDSEQRRGAEKVGRAIGRRRQKKQDARHRVIVCGLRCLHEEGAREEEGRSEKDPGSQDPQPQETDHAALEGRLNRQAGNGI
jgi:hypothetical protein